MSLNLLDQPLENPAFLNDMKRLKQLTLLCCASSLIVGGFLLSNALVFSFLELIIIEDPKTIFAGTIHLGYLMIFAINSLFVFCFFMAQEVLNVLWIKPIRAIHFPKLTLGAIIGNLIFIFPFYILLMLAFFEIAGLLIGFLLGILLSYFSWSICINIHFLVFNLLIFWFMYNNMTVHIRKYHAGEKEDK